MPVVKNQQSCLLGHTLSVYLQLRLSFVVMNNQTALELVEVLDGSVTIPIERNAIFIIVELILSIVGILMNIFIACIIIFSKPLRTKPRNVFLLGLILSNLSAFVPVCMEFAYFISPNHKLCQMYVAIVGLPYVLFLTNLLLALIDRYVAIVHPLWHMDKVTFRFAFFSQLGASIFISVIYKFAYIAQFIPLNCEMQLIQFRIVGVISLILFSSCIVAQTIVYRRTKEIIKNNKKRRGAAARGTRCYSHVLWCTPVPSLLLICRRRLLPHRGHGIRDLDLQRE